MSSQPNLPPLPPVFTRQDCRALWALLPHKKRRTSQLLRSRLQNVASLYRSRVLETVSGPSRKNDWQIYKNMTALAAEASVIVRSLDDDQIAALGSLPQMPVCPRDGPQNKWFKQMSKAIAEVAAPAAR